MWNKWKEWFTNDPKPFEEPYSLTATGLQMQDSYMKAQDQYKAMQNAFQQMTKPLGPWASGLGGGLAPTRVAGYSFDMADMAVRDALRRMRDYATELTQRKTMKQYQDQAKSLRYNGSPIQQDPYTVTWTDNTDSPWYTISTSKYFK